MTEPSSEPEIPTEQPAEVAPTVPAPDPDREPDQTSTAPAPDPDPLRGSVASRTWVALGALAALLIITVVFVAQNTASVPLKLFGWTWHPPLAAALLAAVALGLSIALIAGSLRILQLRRRVRRNRRAQKEPGKRPEK